MAAARRTNGAGGNSKGMKSGIDYFPLDVALDEKFELIEAEFGLTGFGVVVKLLQKIYGGQGYYVEWTNEVALLFAKRIGLGGSAVSEIVEASVKRGIFDKTLYEKYRVLTSKGIQKASIWAVGANKSIAAGIECVAGKWKRRKLFLARSQSTEFLREIFTYRWNDKTGLPVKENDDIMDALRYGVYSDFRDHRNDRKGTGQNAL